jgi:hypothetical protein
LTSTVLRPSPFYTRNACQHLQSSSALINQLDPNLKRQLELSGLLFPEYIVLVFLLKVSVSFNFRFWLQNPPLQVFYLSVGEQVSSRGSCVLVNVVLEYDKTKIEP